MIKEVGFMGGIMLGIVGLSYMVRAKKEPEIPVFEPPELPISIDDPNFRDKLVQASLYLMQEHMPQCDSRAGCLSPDVLDIGWLQYSGAYYGLIECRKKITETSGYIMWSMIFSFDDLSFHPFMVSHCKSKDLSKTWRCNDTECWEE